MIKLQKQSNMGSDCGLVSSLFSGSGLRKMSIHHIHILCIAFCRENSTGETFEGEMPSITHKVLVGSLHKDIEDGMRDLPQFYFGHSFCFLIKWDYYFKNVFLIT